MIQLYINNQEVMIPQSSEIRLLRENPSLTKCSKSTYDIEIPMGGNNPNIAIFGSLNRMDVSKRLGEYTARLIVNNSVVLDGSAVINEITDTVLKVQLLAGNSEMNFRANNEVYINEMKLDLVKPPRGTGANWLEITGPEFGSYPDVKGVWQSVLSGDKIYNHVYYNHEGKGIKYASWEGQPAQPYLCTVIDEIMQKMGYTIGRNDIADSWMKNIYVVNTLGDQYIQSALPNWTVSEFLTQIENFCSVVVVVDDERMTVDFINKNEYYSSSNNYVIDDDKILDEYKVELDSERNTDDVAGSNVNYNLASVQSNNYYDMKIEFRSNMDRVERRNVTEARAAWAGMDASKRKEKIFIASDTDRKFIDFTNANENYFFEVDAFRPIIAREGVKEVSMKIVPAAMTNVDVGLWDQRSGGGLRFDNKGSMDCIIPESEYQSKKVVREHGTMQEIILKSNTKPEAVKKDIMEVAIWNGQMKAIAHNGVNINVNLSYTDYDQPDITKYYGDGSMALDNRIDSIGRRIRLLNKVNKEAQYKIRFVSEKTKFEMNMVFIIRNQKYICESLETNIVNGEFSHIIEGTFYKMT